MLSADLLLAGVLVPLLVLLGIGILAVLHRRTASPALRQVETGRFADALESADRGPRAPRDDLLAAGIAARHLLRLDESRQLLDRLVAEHPDDGEAWLEVGLTASAAGDGERGRAAFRRAGVLRADLAEPLTLHRAWLRLREGDRRGARRLFDEVEVAIEGKLRQDLGGGDPIFAEWFAQAAALWGAAGDGERAAWARGEAVRAAPGSVLVRRLAG